MKNIHTIFPKNIVWIFFLFPYAITETLHATSAAYYTGSSIFLFVFLQEQKEMLRKDGCEK